LAFIIRIHHDARSSECQIHSVVFTIQQKQFVRSNTTQSLSNFWALFLVNLAAGEVFGNLIRTYLRNSPLLTAIWWRLCSNYTSVSSL